MASRHPDTARLLISCPDRAGIIAALSSFLAARGANITASDQHTTDPLGGEFFLRMEFLLPGLRDDRARFEAELRAEVAEPFAMDWTLATGEPKRMAILVSREDHCLLELLWQHRSGALPAEIVLVASNHPDHAGDAAAFGIPYVHVPVTPQTKPAAETALLAHLAGHVDLVVLARYMQILSGDFLDRLAAPLINIHHSFLPAFPGADPYHRAHERGVKLIGATAHYVIEELDAGPIIEQDTVRVTHRAGVEELVRLGREVERAVLARAVGWHLDDRVLRHGNKTIVF